MKDRLILDTNLLCLLVVGMHSREAIADHKRLDIFTVDDYDLLLEIGLRFRSIATCAHVFAETSNLICLTHRNLKPAFRESLAKIIDVFDEEMLPSRTIILRTEYSRLGITDSALLLMAEVGGTLLTDDFDLNQAASQRNYSVVNYNYLRKAEVTPSTLGAWL